MISRRILAAVALLCALVTPAHAQQSKAQLNAAIASSFPDNNAGIITPFILRNITNAIVNSIMPSTVAASGNLACFNGITGLLQDCGSAPSGAWLAKAADYTIGATDCGRTIQAGSGSTGKFTVTLPSVSVFGVNCPVTIVNGDSARGKILSGFPSGAPAVLFPRQSIDVNIINGAWAVTRLPGRWRLPGATILYLDSNGSDTLNDGLAAGAAGAFRTFNGMVAAFLNNIDLNSQVLQLQNAAGQNLADLQLIGNPTGTGTVIFDGGGATINGATGPAIKIDFALIGGVAASLQLQNMTVTCAVGKSGIDVEAGFVTLTGGPAVGGNITFGTCGGAHVVADGAGARVFNPVGQNYTINGNFGYHWLQIAGGLIDSNGGTVQVVGNPTIGTAFAEADYGGPCMISQTTFVGAATGVKSTVTGFGCIQILGGSAFPGTVAGIVDNGAFTGGLSLTKVNAAIFAQSTTDGAANAGSVQVANSNSSSFPAMIANEPGRTTVRYGGPLGGFGEFVDFGSGGNGAYFGVLANKPAIFVTNNADRGRIHGSGGVSFGNAVDPGAPGIVNLLTGLRIGNAAPSGHALVGNGANYVDTALAASATTDTTNASNISSGTLAVARGGVDQTAWTSYTPAITSTGGAFTSVAASGFYKQQGKRVDFRVTITTTTVGGASGRVLMALPVAAVGVASAGSANGWRTDAKETGCILGFDSLTQYSCALYDGTFPATAGSVLYISGFYEAA